MPTSRGFHELDYRAMYALNKHSSKPRPCHVLDSDVRIEAQRLEVEKITGHNRSVHEAASSLSSTRHTGKAYFALPRNGKWTSATPDDTSILQYWSDVPNQHRQTNRLYPQMRIGAAKRELAREKGQRSTSPGYDLKRTHTSATSFREKPNIR